MQKRIKNSVWGEFRVVVVVDPALLSAAADPHHWSSPSSSPLVATAPRRMRRSAEGLRTIASPSVPPGTTGKGIVTKILGPPRNVFVLGVEKLGSVDEVVQMEAKKWDDLIVFDMIDTYNNMTVKTLNILRWITQYCRAPRFFLQV
ncbi:unnamed protein product [Gongylonema pulchrum]|uniref:Hexosyltransferase n=1 Tax=Gongylonema pulchrum TaxID=637853 RepID=A0A183E8N5_9BILA|nr:unnamed protein product [Gongylonema pulchrum]